MKTNFNQVMKILKNINIESNKNKTLSVSFLKDNKKTFTNFEIREDFSELIRKTILFHSDDNIYFYNIILDDKIIFLDKD